MTRFLMKCLFLHLVFVAFMVESCLSFIFNHNKVGRGSPAEMHQRGTPFVSVV